MSKFLKSVPIYHFTRFQQIDRITWIAEASELSPNLYNAMWGRLYEDAMDVGFGIQGKTKIEYFYLASTKRNLDDVTSWCFKPVNNALLNNFIVIVFND